MKNVTCLAWTFLFLVLAGTCGWFVYLRAPWASAAVPGGIGGGLGLLIAAGWFASIPRRIAEWAMIAGAARFGRGLRDGKRAAIVGTLSAQGTLSAPFSRESCVLYSYEAIIRDVQDGESGDCKAYEGFAMVPLTIEHGAERTRILAWPELPGLRSVEQKGRSAEANAKSYVESTTFTVAPSTIPELDLSHTDGRLRLDYYREPRETNIGACRLNETLLPAGAPVCALGTYREDRRALVGPVTLRTGESFAAGAVRRTVNAGLAGMIFTGLVVIGLAIFCANYPLDRAEQLHPEWTRAWWEVDLERFVDRHIRRPMLALGILDAPGFYLQEVCEGCAKGTLEIHGRTIALRHARYAGGKAVHLSAQPGERDGVTLDGRDHVMLTIGGKQADVPPSWLQKNDIQTSLGSHGEYEGRVTVIAPDRSIRCRVSFNTRVDADAWLP